MSTGSWSSKIGIFNVFIEYFLDRKQQNFKRSNLHLLNLLLYSFYKYRKADSKHLIYESIQFNRRDYEEDQSKCLIK
jgi:hypothetical protein